MYEESKKAPRCNSFQGRAPATSKAQRNCAAVHDKHVEATTEDDELASMFWAREYLRHLLQMTGDEFVAWSDFCANEQVSRGRQ